MYMLPVGFKWDHHKGVTLMGDATHLMTPWAGEGVKLAMWDSRDLSHALEGVAVEPRIRDFENAVLARAQEKAEETLQKKENFLSEDGRQRLANFFKSACEDLAEGGAPAQ